MLKIALVAPQKIHRVLFAKPVQRQRQRAEVEPRRGLGCRLAAAALVETAVIQQPHDLAEESVCLVRQIWFRPLF
jgi:hypothetical protein